MKKGLAGKLVMEDTSTRWGFEGLSWQDADMGNIGNATFVRDLWQHNMVVWDNMHVKMIFGNDLGDKICKIPLVRDGPKDKLVLFHANNGIYSTKKVILGLF